MQSKSRKIRLPIYRCQYVRGPVKLEPPVFCDRPSTFKLINKSGDLVGKFCDDHIDIKLDEWNQAGQ